MECTDSQRRGSLPQMEEPDSDGGAAPGPQMDPTAHPDGARVPWGRATPTPPNHH